ncbi:MAG: glycosyltransferase family 2 protein [Paludibacteraceae bacterium]
MKKIAALTMARNDSFFLEKWIAYYGVELGEENLYVFLDGEDQIKPSNAGKTNISVLKHISLSRTEGDKERITLLSHFAESLFDRYDIVIGADADEFLVIDPKCDISLREYLSSIEMSPSVSALGIDIGQHLNKEETLNVNHQVLQQRNFAVVSSRYTKPVVISKPVTWGSGFHRIKGHNFKIDKNLYLFHLGYCDVEILKQKWADDSRIKEGWLNHLKRRTKTIDLITNKKALEGDKYIPAARKLQTVLRPVFALNKPSMGCWKLVIRIPDRFRSVQI